MSWLDCPPNCALINLSAAGIGPGSRDSNGLGKAVSPLPARPAAPWQAFHRSDRISFQGLYSPPSGGFKVLAPAHLIYRPSLLGPEEAQTQDF